MPEAFFTSGGRPRSVASIRRDANGQPQTLAASIADGDTIAVHVEGSGSNRFLGIDSPEKAFELPGSGPRRLDSPEWETYANGIGLFNPVNPLRFEAFEVRYLGRREPPNRAVIDLSRNDDVILRPQNYSHIANSEDRLFIPLPFVPLFVARGWRLEGWF